MLNLKITTPILLTTFMLITLPVALAQRDIRTETIQFDAGQNSTVIEGSIAGYDTVDYVFRVRKGQYLNVSMVTDNTSNYFNILSPGEDEVAIFNGSTRENQYEGILSETGNYKVRVYLMRSAARRDEIANFRLEMIVTQSGNRANNGDALVEGTSYNATGRIPCALSLGQPMGSCDFGVSRQGNGTALVVVTKPDGRTRTIFFEQGEAIGYDINQADPGEFRSEKQGDLSLIWIGQERYEIPDIVIFGD